MPAMLAIQPKAGAALYTRSSVQRPPAVIICWLADARNYRSMLYPCHADLACCGLQ